MGSSSMRPDLDLALTAGTPVERLAVVKREIAAACAEAGRDPASVTLVAVSKTFGADSQLAAMAAQCNGVRP